MILDRRQDSTSSLASQLQPKSILTTSPVLISLEVQDGAWRTIGLAGGTWLTELAALQNTEVHVTSLNNYLPGSGACPIPLFQDCAQDSLTVPVNLNSSYVEPSPMILKRLNTDANRYRLARKKE